MAPLRSHGGVTFCLETPSEDESRHFLDACFLCQRPLNASSIMFMYRGDTPFCSEECRREQIQLDEAREREIRSRRRRHHRHLVASPVEQPVSSAQAAEAGVAS